ncbi:MAG TPA: cytochrome c [Bryobacteraceae bacterium]|jgi:ubiquinol-cytochrome c reductase cytochrome c subunit|nr:cytochrome c [Bryobacteraceae bacterium]
MKLKLYVLMLAGFGLLSAQTRADGNVENGKRLFLKDGCYECHGYAGQGGAGARLAPKVLATANFIKYVRHPAGAMPPYTAKVATDAELADIRAYLATMPEPPALKSIPILNQ